jgi:hypothetical protein
MKRINVKINDIIVWSSYKSNAEYQAWINSCIAANLWGAPGTYVVEVLDADAELEAIRQSQELTTKQTTAQIDSRIVSLENLGIDDHISNTVNPHSTTKAQVGLGDVDNISASNLRDRSTHTGTQLSSTISDFNEAAQDAVGNSLVNSSNISFTYPDAQNQITADLSNTGVTAGTYSLLTVDAKGRITNGLSVGSITRFTYTNNATVANSNATYTTVASLTTVSLPVGLYRFRFFGIAQSGSTTNGMGIRIVNGTSTISTILAKWFIGQGANGTTQNFQYDQIALNTNVTSASAQAANTNFSIIGEGVFRVTVAGTATIQIRSELNGTAASLLADSNLEVWLA